MMVDILPAVDVNLNRSSKFHLSDSDSEDGYFPSFHISDDESDTDLIRMDQGPSVIVLPEPGNLSELTGCKFQALADDESYFLDSTEFQCRKFYEEWRFDIEANERILSDSESMESEDEAIFVERTKKTKKRVRWKNNLSVDACEQQTKHGRQAAAEALLSMDSPSTNSESKTFLQGILQQNPNTDGLRAAKKNGDLFQSVVKIRTGHAKTHLRVIFKDEATTTVKRDKFAHTKSSESELFAEALDSNTAFIKVFRDKYEKRGNESSYQAGFSSSADLDVKIAQKSILGTFEVSLEQLEEPTEETLFRKVDSKFVDALKDGILRSNVSSYVHVFPVNCVSVQSIADFREADIASYRFQTLGGNHLRQALLQIASEKRSRREPTQVVKIYVGLTTPEALRVASDHNTRTHFKRKTSFFEEASLCRKTIKKMPNDDAKACTLDKEWREMCQALLCREKQSLGSIDMTFQVAGYSKRCWDKFESVDRRFNARELKGQSKQKDMKPISQTPFMHLQGLAEEDKFDLLSQVADGFISLRDMMSLADLRKKKRTVKQKMMTCLGDEVTTWDDAVKKYPLHTNDEAITNLCQLKFTKESLPPTLVEHCENAKTFALNHKTNENISLDISSGNVIKIHDVYISNIPKPTLSDWSTRDILNKDAEHALIYLHFEQNERQQAVAETIKNATTLSACPMIAAFGSFKQLDCVQSYCKAKQMTTERIFQYSTSLATKDTKVLLDHVVCGLICFHIGNERMNEPPQHSNMWCFDSNTFKKELVRVLTRPGEWFIQCVGKNDEVCVDAIEQGRKLFVFTGNPDRDIAYIRRHFEETNVEVEGDCGKVSDSDSEDNEPLCKYKKLEKTDLYDNISDSDGEESLPLQKHRNIKI